MEIREERPSYVQFKRMPVEKRDAKGNAAFVDEDFAVITPIGSKDRIERKVTDWLAQMEQQVREERLPLQWLEGYRSAYNAWQKGQELPLNGTPIKGWPALSPAQQETVIRANILTVEDLAQISAEPQARIGMGALDMKNKAIAFLKAQSGPAKLASEMAAMQLRLDAIEKRNLELEAANTELKAQVKALSPKEE
jgi:hypothetical protein